MVRKTTGFARTRTIKVMGGRFAENVPHVYNFVMAYSKKSVADRMASELKKKGWSVRRFTVTQKGKKWYTVYKAKRWWR